MIELRRVYVLQTYFTGWHDCSAELPSWEEACIVERDVPNIRSRIVRRIYYVEEAVL